MTTAEPSSASSSSASGGGQSLSLAAVLGYAAPQFALAALYFPVFALLAPFYDQALGLPLAALGGVLVAVRLLDAVTDPLMGAVSDATRSRFGRRKIWLLVATPFVCLSVWMAFVPPPDAGILYFAVWIAALSLAWTVAITPYLAWGGEIAQDYAGRARVTGWREAMTVLGTLAAVTLFASAGDDAAQGMRRVALMVLICLPIGAALAMVLAPSPRARGQAAAPVSLSAWRKAVAEVRANAAFRSFMGAHIANSAAIGLPPVLVFYFVQDVLGAGADAFGVAFTLYLAAALLGAPVWTALATRGAKHRVWGWAMLYAMGVFAFAPLLGEGDETAFFVISVLTGFAYGADLALPPAIQADVVDADTASTGVDRCGVYFALLSVVLKGASGLAGGAALILLGLAGFEAGAENAPGALLTVSLLYAAAPILLKGVAVALIWNFPIDAAKQAELRRVIDAAKQDQAEA